MKTTNDTKKWVAERFGIPYQDVEWYHSGICYDRVGVLSQQSADKITEYCHNAKANGGMLDGMPLGGQTKYSQDDGTVIWDVYC